MFSTLIAAPELNARLSDASWIIIDCRYDLKDAGAGYRAYLEGHVPGAMYAHLHDDLSGPPDTDRGRHPLPAPQRLRELFSSYGIGPGCQVVAYDDAGGSTAGRLWWMLRYMNHEAVAVLDGGWPAWCAAKNEFQEDEVRRARRHFEGDPRRELLVTLNEVPGCVRLIDSREPARYRGEQESIDAVAGHIPGAGNYFWKRNVDEHGYFRPANAVRQQLQAQMGDVPANEVTFYCGSGVSACQNVLAAVHAGFPFPRLYVGSWSEWCSDPARPVATGPG